jgi:hypothetical protein
MGVFLRSILAKRLSESRGVGNLREVGEEGGEKLRLLRPIAE